MSVKSDDLNIYTTSPKQLKQPTRKRNTVIKYSKEGRKRQKWKEEKELLEKMIDLNMTIQSFIKHQQSNINGLNTPIRRQRLKSKTQFYAAYRKRTSNIKTQIDESRTMGKDIAY